MVRPDRSVVDAGRHHHGSAHVGEAVEDGDRHSDKDGANMVPLEAVLGLDRLDEVPQGDLDAGRDHAEREAGEQSPGDLRIRQRDRERAIDVLETGVVVVRAQEDVSEDQEHTSQEGAEILRPDAEDPHPLPHRTGIVSVGHCCHLQVDWGMGNFEGA